MVCVHITQDKSIFYYIVYHFKHQFYALPTQHPICALSLSQFFNLFLQRALLSFQKLCNVFIQGVQCLLAVFLCLSGFSHLTSLLLSSVLGISGFQQEAHPEVQKPGSMNPRWFTLFLIDSHLHSGFFSCP